MYVWRGGINKMAKPRYGAGSDAPKSTTVEKLDNNSSNLFEALLADDLSRVPYKQPAPLKSKISEEELIEKLAGGDLTEGSCASLAYAYVANKEGNLDVTDYRGGSSQTFFSAGETSGKIAQLDGVKSELFTSPKNNGILNANNALNSVQPGKEYILFAGKHAAIVRKNKKSGKLEYLEMQERHQKLNGFIEFNKSTLKDRFHCQASSKKYLLASRLIETKSLGTSSKFAGTVGYINTDSNKQKKGISGYAK